MKVKKILTGKQAGEIVELSADEKVRPTLQDGLIDHQIFKDKIHVWIKDVKSEPVAVAPNGKPFNGKWANNTYRVKGTCSVHRRDLAKDALLPVANYHFEMAFEDKLDSMGQPDTKVKSLKLEET